MTVTETSPAFESAWAVTVARTIVRKLLNITVGASCRAGSPHWS